MTTQCTHFHLHYRDDDEKTLLFFFQTQEWKELEALPTVVQHLSIHQGIEVTGENSVLGTFLGHSK